MRNTEHARYYALFACSSSLKIIVTHISFAQYYNKWNYFITGGTDGGKLTEELLKSRQTGAPYTSK